MRYKLPSSLDVVAVKVILIREEHLYIPQILLHALDQTYKADPNIWGYEECRHLAHKNRAKAILAARALAQRLGVPCDA